MHTQVGRSRVNMLKLGFSNKQEAIDCGIRQTMQLLLVCPMIDTAWSPQDLTTANDIAIGCARHWEGNTTPGGRTRMMMTVAAPSCKKAKLLPPKIKVIPANRPSFGRQPRFFTCLSLKKFETFLGLLM